MFNDLRVRYWGSFAISSLVCLFAQLYVYCYAHRSQTPIGGKSIDEHFQKFQRKYLIVYTLANFADWLQGPYIYELYVSYGFNQDEIAELFVCGFASSLVVGTFIGGLADKLGRKALCIAYCLFYITACFTKLVPDYWTLMFGRFLSGISASLLFSVFESWMVCEHNKRGFDSNLLGSTFSNASFLNGLGAVVAGLIANSAADWYGFVAPFMASVVPLCTVVILIVFTWTENFGQEHSDSMSSLRMGFDLILTDYEIAALGLGQSAFEGAMYTFVFMFTPALKADGEVVDYSLSAPLEASSASSLVFSGKSVAPRNPAVDVSVSEAKWTGINTAGSSSNSIHSVDSRTAHYLGLIFTVFMVCSMLGSISFTILQRKHLYRLPLAVHCIAAISMLTTACYFEDKGIVYLMFLIFEVTVGLFYPSYGTIKSEIIPESVRSSVMNIFRIPLNLFVVVLLLNIEQLEPTTVFFVCFLAHSLGFCCYLYVYIKRGLGAAAYEPLSIDCEDDDHIRLLEREKSSTSSSKGRRGADSSNLNSPSKDSSKGINNTSMNSPGKVAV
jgi:MFS family permease